METLLNPVLIIEDDLSTLELYARILSREYQVSGCMDEQETLDILPRYPWQAIILEPKVWGGRGWEILINLKKTTSGQRIPVILCSTLDERKRGLELGAAACLVKPVLPTRLAEILRRVILPSGESVSAPVGIEIESK